MKEATWQDAYPLTWPNAWPRSKPHERRGARFLKTERRASNVPGGGSYIHKSDITIPVAIERLREQLTKIEVNWDRVIVSTNVETRRD